jgi:hypothetical protein
MKWIYSAGSWRAFYTDKNPGTKNVIMKPAYQSNPLFMEEEEP